VALATARGRAGQVTSVWLEFDSISAVGIEDGTAAVVDFGLVPVSPDAAVGGELIPCVSYPMRLPLTHPSYPCTLGQGEDLTAAREFHSDSATRPRVPNAVGRQLADAEQKVRAVGLDFYSEEVQPSPEPLIKSCVARRQQALCSIWKRR
jgi:hypothetical protein